jgi:hypothetical protein
MFGKISAATAEPGFDLLVMGNRHADNLSTVTRAQCAPLHGE